MQEPRLLLTLDYLYQLLEKIRKCPTDSQSHAHARYQVRYQDVYSAVFVVPIPIVNRYPATLTATAAVFVMFIMFVMFVMFGVICMTHHTGYSEL